MGRVYYFFLMSSFLIILSGCAVREDKNLEKLNSEVMSESNEQENLADEQVSLSGTEGFLNEANRVLPEEQLPPESSAEYMSNEGGQEEETSGQTVIEFAEDFINKFQGAIANEEEIALEYYIESENLRNFAYKMIELSRKQVKIGMNSVPYGADNEFREAEINENSPGIFYVKITFCYEGSGMACQFLVRDQDFRMTILDFYFGYEDGVDSVTTGHWTERKVNDPNLWEDADWIRNINSKLSDFEEQLNQMLKE